MNSIISTPSPSHSHRNCIQGEDVRDTIHTLAQLAKDATDLANIPFASQAASLLVSITEVAKEVKDNDNARNRLINAVNTYFTQLRPFLDNIDNSDAKVLKELDSFFISLQVIHVELLKLKNKKLLKRISSKSRTATKLVNLEMDMRTACNTLMLSIGLDTNKIVRNIISHEKTIDVIDETPRFSSQEVQPIAFIPGACGFFAGVVLGEVYATRQRVIMKRMRSTIERDREARKWSKLWHPNLPHMIGHSTDKSKMQFILFHNLWFDTSGRVEHSGNLAAFVMEISRTHDIFSIFDILVDFVNDAISAIRHIQNELDFTEDEAAFLANIAKYTLSPDGRIIVVPPLQSLGMYGSSVSNNIFWSLFPTYGTSETSIRRYLADLDGAPTYGTLTMGILDSEQLEKWSLVDTIRGQIRILPNSVERPQQYLTPETQWIWIDYFVDIKPGNFGVLVPGEQEEYAFRRVGNPSSVLFSYQSVHWLDDRNNVGFDVVQEQPLTWKLDRMTNGCAFAHQHYQRLNNDVYRSKQILQLSAPKDCGMDELVLVVSCSRYHSNEYMFCSGSSDEPQIADIYAELRDLDNEKLHFSHYNPAVCPDYHPLDSRIRIDKTPDYLRIEYVTVPVKKNNTKIEIKDKKELGLFKYKEYESSIQCSPAYNECNLAWREWP